MTSRESRPSANSQGVKLTPRRVLRENSIRGRDCSRKGTEGSMLDNGQRRAIAGDRDCGSVQKPGPCAQRNSIAPKERSNAAGPGEKLAAPVEAEGMRDCRIIGISQAHRLQILRTTGYRTQNLRMGRSIPFGDLDPNRPHCRVCLSSIAGLGNHQRSQSKANGDFVGKAPALKPQRGLPLNIGLVGCGSSI